MDYNDFINILNKSIFHKVKLTLLEKVAKNPDRYVGLFRPTKPRAKLVQNITQSNEIRFGDAFEVILEEYLKIMGFEMIPRSYTFNGDNLKFDQFFKDETTIYFIEQKIRDDHDSTKKRGQIDNFEKKTKLLFQLYPDYDHIGIMYFVDSSLRKNRKYYVDELNRISNVYQIESHLFYGEEFFQWINYSEIWLEIIQHLESWKKDISDFPELNFDIEAEESFNEIKEITPGLFLKLLENDIIFSEIILTLFPEKKTLSLLLEYYKTKKNGNKIFQKIVSKLESKLYGKDQILASRKLAEFM